MRRSIAGVPSIAALMRLATSLVGAHDFWLVPDDFALGPDPDIAVRGQTSSAFPTSESAVAVDRLTEARVLGAGGDETIAVRTTEGTSLLLRHRPKTPGQKVITASLGWRSVKETAESFRRYLVLEGAEDAMKRYEQAGKLPTSNIVRRYAKYAKTIVEFGQGPRAFDRVAGQPLEFVPQADPAAARAGATVRLRLLFQGRPLANARVHAGRAGQKDQSSAIDRELTTSPEGILSLPLDAAGLWNVRTIHIVPTPPGGEADWDAHWASYVFRVN